MTSHLLANAAIGVLMQWNRWALRVPLLKAAHRVEQAQADLLAAIWRDNAGTLFGREHGFAEIATMADYRGQVAVQTYDELEPYIVRQQDGERALTTAAPVSYTRTSGTTGRHKDIPLTKDGKRQLRHAQSHLALALWRDTDFFTGSILGFASPAEEGRLANGKSYGSMSGSAYHSLAPVVARKFAVPVAAFAIKDMAAKYQLYALAALAADDVTGIAAANPSSILKVATIIDEQAPCLVHALASGDGGDLAPEAAAFLEDIARRADPRRIARLRDSLSTRDRLTPDTIWPRLSAIATWTGGSCGVALGRLLPLLPEGVKVVEYGYGASEFMGAANVDASANLCLPLVTHHVYEFVRRADWENEQPTFLGLHELSPGEDYYIFMTTRSGLYRNHINDIVRAEPGIGPCPGLRFLQKGRGVTNITGEKLSEDQLIAAVGDVLAANGLSATSFLALADEAAARYVLYLEGAEAADCEGLAVQLDERLRLGNGEYDDKRGSGRLHALVLKRFCDGAGDTIKARCVERGVREAQYKPTLLDYARNWSGKLDGLAAGDDG